MGRGKVKIPPLSLEQHAWHARYARNISEKVEEIKIV